MPTGLVLVVLSVLSLGYAVLDDPAMDQRKPLWVLDAERRVFGESRDARTRAEITRRLDAVPTSIEVQAALTDVVLDYSAKADAHPQWHTLGSRVIGSGWVQSDDAAEHVRLFIETFVAADPGRREALRDAGVRYLTLVGIDTEAVEPLLSIVESGYREASSAPSDEPLKAWAMSPARAVLSTWAEVNWSRLPFDFQRTLAGSLESQVTLRMDSHVRSGDEARYVISVGRVPLAFGTRHSTSIEPHELRVGGHSYRLHGSSRSIGSGPSLGSSSASSSIVQLRDTATGTADVELDVRIGYHIGQSVGIAAGNVGGDAAGDKQHWPIFTLTTQVVVLPADTPDARVLMAPVEQRDALLDAMSLVPLAVDDDGDVLVKVSFTGSPLDLDHKLIMRQAGLTAELTNLMIREGSHHTSSAIVALNDTGVDLDRPVLLVLEPRKTIGFDSDGNPGVGARFEIGWFTVDRTDAWPGAWPGKPVRDLRIAEP
ncbi:MAG: hypothetical protein AAFS11_06625 [Planctomycetota bacterium]